MADEKVSVGLTADSRSFVKSFNEAAQAVGHVKSATMGLVHTVDYAKGKIVGMAESTVKSYLRMAAVATVGFGGTALMFTKATKAFASFEEQMANVSTVMSGATVSVSDMGAAVVNLTTKLPQTAEQLAQGLYAVNSAGYQGAEALRILEQVAKFSAAGLTEMEISAAAVTGILHAYKLEAEDAAMVTDVLFKAVEVGQMTGAEFAHNVGDWASSAATMGVSFQTAAAAMAVLTTTGALPANQAATSLNAILRQLMRPTEEMTRAFQKLGVSSGKQAIEAWGLAETLNKLWQVSGKSETVWARMMADSEALKGSFTLVGSGLEDMIRYQAEFNDQSFTSGTTQRAFEKQMSAVNNQLKLMGNGFRQLRYEAGLAAAPIAKFLLGGVNAVLRGVLSMPEPVKRTLGYLQLMLPAMTSLAVIGGMFYLNSLKTALALKGIAKIGLLFGNAGMLGAAGAVGRFGQFVEAGPIKQTVKAIWAFVAANNAAKISMIQTHMATVGLVAGYLVLAYTMWQVYKAFGDAERKADRFYDSIGDPSKIQTLDELELGLTKVNEQLMKVSHVATDSTFEKIGLALKGTFELLTPVENGVQNHIALYEKGSKEAKAYANAIMAMNSALMMVQENVFTPGEFSSSITDVSSALTIQAINAAQAAGEFDWNAYIETIRQYEDVSNDLIEAQIAGKKPKQEDVALEKELRALREEQEAVLKKYAKQIHEVDVAEHSATASSSRLQLALLAFNDPVTSATEKLEAYRKILDEANKSQNAVKDSQAKALSAFEALGATMKKVGRNFDLSTSGGREFQSAVSAAADAMADLMGTTFEMTGSTKAAEAAQQSYAAGLIKMAKNANWTDDQITNLLYSIGMTPAEVTTLMSLSGDKEAMRQLLTMQTFLAMMDGWQIEVDIWIKTRKDGGDPGSFPSLPTVKDAEKQVDQIMNMVASKQGGGGGGSSRWKPNKTQIANMKAALALPIKNLLTGEMGKAWQDQISAEYFDGLMKNFLMKGTTVISASMLKAAQKKGQDPTQDFEQLVSDYNRLVKAVGKANADLALDQFTNLASFQKYVDAMEALIQHQKDVQDWEFSNHRISYADYRAILQARLAATQAYSDEYMQLMDQIKQVDSDQKAEEDRLMAAKLALKEIDKQQYVDYLKARLAATEKYSEEYMALWQEIQSAEQELTDTANEKSDALKNFADAVKNAFEDIKKSVEDPILKATSLVSAFGDQAAMSGSQLQGFYSHMMEGTQRWVTAIKELKTRGVNQKFLTELIQAGPQSVGFAESVLALGADGISFINESMQSIQNMASGLGTDIATGLTGTATQVDQSVNITVGDITITGEMPNGIGLTEVNQAIQDALNSVATQVQNRQGGPILQTTGA